MTLLNHIQAVSNYSIETILKSISELELKKHKLTDWEDYRLRALKIKLKEKINQK